MYLRKRVFIKVYYDNLEAVGYLSKNVDGFYIGDILLRAYGFDSLEIAQATLVNIYNGLGLFKVSDGYRFEFLDIYIPMD